jgi:hypothetical protein
LSRNLGTLTSWNPLGHSRPVTGLLYLLPLLFEETITDENYPISFTHIVALMEKNELVCCFQKDGERAHIEN